MTDLNSCDVENPLSFGRSEQGTIRFNTEIIKLLTGCGHRLWPFVLELGIMGIVDYARENRHVERQRKERTRNAS